MASLFRVTIVEYWIRNAWIDADGKPCKKGTPGARFVESKKVRKGTAGAEKVSKLSSKWYGQLDSGGKRIPLSTNRTAAQQMLADLVRDRELGRVGMSEASKADRRRPIAELLEEFAESMRNKNRVREHIEKTCAQCKAIIEGCGFERIEDLNAEAIASFLRRLREDPPRPKLPKDLQEFTVGQLAEALGGIRPQKIYRILERERLPATGNGKARRYPRSTVQRLQEIMLRGISISTSNGYATAIKSFSRWLAMPARPGMQPRLQSDPLVGLQKLNAEVDRRHERRAIPAEELRKLLAAAGNSAELFRGLGGGDRRVLYHVAMTTGFRASELASLTPAAFDLAAEVPTVTVKAAYSKNRRQTMQPLPADVAELLRGYLEKRPAHKPLWPGEWQDFGAEMLRGDLEAAGIPYRDAAGKVADLHALRHSYITLLKEAGVSPKNAQELARHSDIRLTMDVYTHTRASDLADDVRKLPRLG